MHVFFALGLHQLKLASLLLESQNAPRLIRQYLAFVIELSIYVIRSQEVGSLEKMCPPDVDVLRFFMGMIVGEDSWGQGRAASAWALGSARLFCCRYAEKWLKAARLSVFLREAGWHGMSFSTLKGICSHCCLSNTWKTKWMKMFRFQVQFSH